MRSRLLLLILLLGLAIPAAALAQSSPFQPLPQAPPPEEPTATTSNSLNDDDGLESWQEILILGAGLILIAGIGWAIVLDARRRAPDGPEDRSTESQLRTGLSPDQKAKQRQKQKAARKAR